MLQKARAKAPGRRLEFQPIAPFGDSMDSKSTHNSGPEPNSRQGAVNRVQVSLAQLLSMLLPTLATWWFITGVNPLTRVVGKPLRPNHPTFARFLPRARFNVRGARDALELSLVDGAELVFATLSSTGRRVLQQGLSRGFDTVRGEPCTNLNKLQHWKRLKPRHGCLLLHINITNLAFPSDAPLCLRLPCWVLGSHPIHSDVS